MGKSFLRIDPALVRRLDRANDTLLRKVLPPIMQKVVEPIRQSMVKHLPDGVESGTRQKQSAATKKAFPGHMKDNVIDKQLSDTVGVLQIVGVSTRKAGQVNFDHGEKAKTTGRRHVLWWPKEARVVGVKANGEPMTYGGKPFRVHDPEFRRQTYDVAAHVDAEVTGTITKIVEAGISAAIAKGDI